MATYRIKDALMKVKTKRRMTNWLPATVVKPELRAKVVATAQREGVSLGEIQRRALEFFLRDADTHGIANDTQATQ